MTDGPVRTVFLGSGAFGAPILLMLAMHRRVQIAGIVTAPPRPAGRGGDVARTPVHEQAARLGIDEILTPTRLRAPEALAAIEALRPTLAVLADYGQIVPAPVLDLPHGALNLHPSLLPRHRGATPVPAAILAGDAETGVTLMRMDEGLDTGPIIDQVRVGMNGLETTPAFEEYLGGRAADLLAADLGPWLDGALPAIPQDESQATMTRRFRREDGRLDPTRSAVALERQVRALQPWPGTFVETIEGRLVIWEAEVGGEGPPAGTFDETGIGVGDGERLALIEVQPAGGQRMPWVSFLRGRPSIVGSSIVP